MDDSKLTPDQEYQLWQAASILSGLLNELDIKKINQEFEMSDKKYRIVFAPIENSPKDKKHPNRKLGEISDQKNQDLYAGQCINTK